MPSSIRQAESRSNAIYMTLQLVCQCIEKLTLSGTRAVLAGEPYVPTANPPPLALSLHQMVPNVKELVDELLCEI